MIGSDMPMLTGYTIAPTRFPSGKKTERTSIKGESSNVAPKKIPIAFRGILLLAKDIRYLEQSRTFGVIHEAHRSREM